MDTPSVDNDSTGQHNHHALLGSGKVLIEGLVGLTELMGQTVSFAALPVKWENADGAPCRAVAWKEG
jgi:kynurenine formamidase